VTADQDLDHAVELEQLRQALAAARATAAGLRLLEPYVPTERTTIAEALAMAPLAVAELARWWLRLGETLEQPRCGGAGAEVPA
jgi:hypothetical protein